MFKWLFWIFLASFLAALGFFMSNMMGWFGQTPDALAGLYLLPFGLPWNLIGVNLPDPFPLIFGLGAPLLNLAILFGLWRWSARRNG